MKKILLQLVFFLTFVIPVAFAQNAKEIIKKAEDKSKGKSSIANITIQIIRPTWSREMSIKAWTKGNDLALILVTAPAREKGVVFLKRYKEIWNWIPSIERSIKMPPSMMSQSWMGTDFTNDDLVKEGSVLEDYNHSILKEEVVDERSCFKIQLLPKPSSAVIWGKVIMYVDKKDFLILQVEYFDEDGILINTMHASDVKMLGGRLLPGRLEMIPANKKENKTVLLYKAIQFDASIDDSFFTTQNITKVR